MGYDEETDEMVEDRSEEEAKTMHPGEIDNLPIASIEYHEELRRGLTEGEEYELIPENAWLKLHSWYDGGPVYKRKVLSRGGGGVGAQKMTFVELYPIRFQLYLCDDDGNPSVPEDSSSKDEEGENGEEPEPILMHFSSSETFNKVKYGVAKKLGVSSSDIRYWVKSEEEAESDDDEEADGDGEKQQEEKKKEEGSKMEEEKGKEGDEDEEEDDGWILVESSGVDRKALEELVQNAVVIHIMLELPVRPSTLGRLRGGKSQYPRDAKMMKWTDGVNVDDIIDGKDSDGNWYEAIVLEIKSDRSQFKVHYRGWAEKWDCWLDINPDVMAKLHTKVDDWRGDLTPNTKIEVKIKTDRGTHKWYEGKVMEINDDEKQVLVWSEYHKESEFEGKKRWVDIDCEELCQFGTHLKRAKRMAEMTSYYGGFGSRSNTKGKPSIEGAVGLSNLGNTCFMNSMLQCLSNTPHLTEYFVNDEFEPDINKNNVLGTGGKLAKAYANLMKDMWGGDYTVVVPSRFKMTIGEFAPQFAGYQQQDSQELMNYLLDGLHEDLNRIQTKPYTQNIESRGRDDRIIAEESWRRFLQRNDSKMVDSCYGQLRSHVTCTRCGTDSTTFDPFLSLSLPIPVQNEEKLRVVFYPLPLGSTPVELLVNVPITCSVKEVKEMIVKMYREENEDGFVMIESKEDGKEGDEDENAVYTHACVRMTSNTIMNRLVQDRGSVRDLAKSSYSKRDQMATCFIYQLEHNAPAVVSHSTSSMYSRTRRNKENEKPKALDILMAKPGGKKVSYSSSHYVQLRTWGAPHRLSVPPECSERMLHQKVWKVMKNYLNRDSPFSNIDLDQGSWENDEVF